MKERRVGTNGRRTYTEGLKESIDTCNVVGDERVKHGHVLFVEYATIHEVLKDLRH